MTYAGRMGASAPPFLLERIDGDPLSLEELTSRGAAVVVFAHADCPTSTLALRRLATAGNGGGATLACVAEETPSRAAQLARRTGVRFPVLSEPAPFDTSRAYGIETVPTAVRIEPGGEITGSVVGWDQERYEALLGTALPTGDPMRKPGCGARWTYEAVGGLDELEDMFERGWSDGLPVVPPTPERVEAMLGGADPSLSLGPVPPAHGEATLERVAACAVLAGCRPGYFPVVRAAAEAALEPGFNAHGIAVTTQPVHRHLAGDIVGGEEKRAGVIGRDMQWPDRQQGRIAMRCQPAISADLEGERIVILVRTRRAHGTAAGLGVAGHDIEEFPGGMRPGILDIGGQGDAVDRRQGCGRYIEAIGHQLGADAGVEGDGFGCPGWASGKRRCRQAPQKSGKVAPVQHSQSPC